MASCGCTDDLGLLTVDPATDVTPQKLLDAVAAELLGEGVIVGLELFEGLDGGLGQQVFHTVEPNLAGGFVNKEGGVAIPKLAHDIAIGDVYVNLVEGAFAGREGFAARMLAQVCKLAKGGAGISTFGEFGVLGCGAKVFVVAETTVAKNLVDFGRGEVLKQV